MWRLYAYFFRNIYRGILYVCIAQLILILSRKLVSISSIAKYMEYYKLYQQRQSIFILDIESNGYYKVYKYDERIFMLLYIRDDCILHNQYYDNIHVDKW